MVIFSKPPIIRDVSSWKMILEETDDSSSLVFFVADSSGRLAIFSRNLPHLARLSLQALSSSSVRELLASLRGGQGEEAPLSDFMEFPGANGAGKRLAWWRFSFEQLPSPAGIYFLYAVPESSQSTQWKISVEHLIQKKLKKLKLAASQILLDTFDEETLSTGVRQIMDWEDPHLRSNRIILPDGHVLSDQSRPVYLRYEWEEGDIRMHSEPPVYGTQIFFRNLVGYGPRPAMVVHTEKVWQYEVLFPLSWHIHILGWVGVPLPGLDWWRRPVRFNFEEMIRGLGDALGESRMLLGLFPHYDIQGGIFGEASFVDLIDSMLAHKKPRPFLLLLVRCRDAEHLPHLAGSLMRTKRVMDVMSRVPQGLVLLFPDQDLSRQRCIERRYRGVVEGLCSEKPGMACSLASVHISSSLSGTLGRDLLNELVDGPAENLAFSGTESCSGTLPEEFLDFPASIAY